MKGTGQQSSQSHSESRAGLFTRIFGKCEHNTLRTRKMIADPTIHALVDLFKHLFRIRAIPFQWDSQRHLLTIPTDRKHLIMWYINFASSVIFTFGFLYRFWSNFFAGNFALAEKVICFYLVAVQSFYTVMMINSWTQWDNIPIFINQWLLFNKNSSKISGKFQQILTNL